jgi:hypothetical protein
VAAGDFAHARCTRLQSCSVTVLAIRYGDEATCEAREKQNSLNALAAPGNGNTPMHTEACAQAVASWSCGDFVDNVSPPLACQQQTGTVSNSQPCGFPGQCQSGFCAIVPGNACGACAAAPTAGASCAQLTTCGPGMLCTTDTQTCVVFGVSGAACGKGAPCGAGLSCVGANANTGVQGKCAASVMASGATCDPTQQTGPGCDRDGGLVCNSQSKQCASLTLSPGGQPCGDVSHQTALCSAGGTCSASSPGSAGTCTAAAADGAPCDLVNGPACEGLARCIVASSGGTSGSCHPNDASMCH